mmetsp:Transcript_15506/g.46834  ORF Transcript_15506/g.46834 Transcript_15506/m.46834 type:complete len:394 (+) Transcript_15506:2521-3702(+)
MHAARTAVCPSAHLHSATLRDWQRTLPSSSRRRGPCKAVSSMAGPSASSATVQLPSTCNATISGTGRGGTSRPVSAGLTAVPAGGSGRGGLMRMWLRRARAEQLLPLAVQLSCHSSATSLPPVVSSRMWRAWGLKARSRRRSGAACSSSLPLGWQASSKSASASSAGTSRNSSLCTARGYGYRQATQLSPLPSQGAFPDASSPKLICSTPGGPDKSAERLKSPQARSSAPLPLRPLVASAAGDSALLARAAMSEALFGLLAEADELPGCRAAAKSVSARIAGADMQLFRLPVVSSTEVAAARGLPTTRTPQSCGASSRLAWGGTPGAHSTTANWAACTSTSWHNSSPSAHLSSSVEVMLTVSLPECSVLQMCCCCLEGLSNDVATTSTDLTSR